MTAHDFVLWMNGAVTAIGETPPTAEQWATLREKLGEAVGELVADKLLASKRAAVERQRVYDVLDAYRNGARISTPQIPNFAYPTIC